MARLYQFGSFLSSQLARPSCRLFSQSIPVSLENGLLSGPEAQSVSLAAFSTTPVDSKLATEDTASKPKRPTSAFMMFKSDYKKTLIESGKSFERQELAGLASEAWDEMDEPKRQPYVYLSLQDGMRKKQIFKAEAKHQDAPGPIKPEPTVRSDAFFVASMPKGTKRADSMEKWESMSLKEKKPFEELHEKDQVRYQEERKEYQIKLKGYQKSLEPMKPKRVASAYLHFNSHMFKKNEGSGKTAAVVVAESSEIWNKMSQKDKKVYQNLEAKDKLRYEADMKKYELEVKGYQKSLGPVKPKRATTAYLHFNSHMFKKNEASGKTAAVVVAESAKLWKNFSEQDKKRFQYLEEKDKLRYEEDLKKYELELAEHQKSVEQ